MKAIVLFILAVTSSFTTFAQLPDWVWAKSAGGTFDDMGNGIATDASGNVYVTGSYAGPTITFGNNTFNNNGFKDFFIVKYGPTGNVLWAKRAGRSGTDEGAAIAIDAAGDVYVTGTYGDSITFGNITLTGVTFSLFNVFLVKYSSSGNVIWARSSYGTGAQAIDMVIDPDGNPVIMGYGHGILTFDTITVQQVTSDALFIVKYNNEGSPLWVQLMESNDDDRMGGIDTDDEGNIYATGTFSGDSISFGSQAPITLYSTANNSGNLFVSKFNPSGNAIWAKGAYATLNNSECTAPRIATDGSGNAYVTGQMNKHLLFDTIDLSASTYQHPLFMAKYTTGGDLVWVKQSSGSMYTDDKIKDLLIDENDDLYVAGAFYDSTFTFGGVTLSNLRSGLFIAQCDTAGDIDWIEVVDAEMVYPNTINALAKDVNKNIFITGYFSRTIEFDNITLTNTNNSAGQVDFFAAKLKTTDPPGIEEPGQRELVAAYPNPATGMVSIVLPFAKGNYRLTDVSGKIVLTGIVTSSVVELNLAPLRSGIYFITITNGNKILNGKVAKE